MNNFGFRISDFGFAPRPPAVIDRVGGREIQNSEFKIQNWAEWAA
jgi:hypothetical protein